MNASELTLRAKIDEQKQIGRALGLREALALIVPLTAELAEQHRQGHHFFVYANALSFGSDGFLHLNSMATQLPKQADDQAALAPELKEGHPGDARTSVYAIAALLYELVTLQVVGPQMKRPAELAAGITHDFELILSKALVSEPRSRPDDLNALAQAFHLINPSASIAPPLANTAHLDHDDGFDVDVSLSMLPPLVATKSSPSFAEAPVPPDLASLSTQAVTRDLSASRLSDTEMLLLLKQRLQKDATARYVVISSGMDHGPFRGLELIQQIANHVFTEDDEVKDSSTGSISLIANSPLFSPFARHARLSQSEVREKAAIEQAVQLESRNTRSKSLVGLAVLAALLLIGGAALLTSRGKRNDAIKIQQEVAANVDSEKSLKTKQTVKKRGGKTLAAKGGIPQVRGGLSCAAAQSSYVREVKMNGPQGNADLTAGAFGAQLNTGTYLNGCGIGASTSISICAAIQNGKAVGVTVTTSPKLRAANSCVANKVRAMRFPSNPKLDITTTTFAGQ